MGEAVTKHESSLSTNSYKRLQLKFLIGYLLAATGDNLQGSYRYALYASYSFTRSKIQLLYIISYASSLVFGTFTASLADRFGRRLACILSAALYVVFCILLNFSPFWVSIVGSVFWGIANAFFHTGFEAWIIQENRDRFLGIQSLKQIFRNSYVGSAIVAIISGIIAQLLAYYGGFVIPFDIAIVFFLGAIICVVLLWSENYGTRNTRITTSFITAFRILRADPRVVLLGMSSAFFDAALYIFIIEWTPAFQRTLKGDDPSALPYGMIFSLLMGFEMIGTFVFELLAHRIRAQSYMIGVFFLAAIALMISVIFPHTIAAVLMGFITYELCVGISHPSLGLLRSFYFPNEVRSTMMSYTRVPQIIIMLIILLCPLSLSAVLICCIVCNILGMICMIVLRGLKLPEEQTYRNENEMLIEEPSSPSFKLRQPDGRKSSTASLIPQTSAKSDDIE